jgi:membrane-associated phospholipid phosphatase
MPTYLFLLEVFLVPFNLVSFPSPFFYYSLILIFISTALFPSLFIFMLYRWGIILDMQVYKRSDRVYPYLLTSLLYIGLSVFYYQKFGIDPYFTQSLLVIAGIIMAVTIINTFWKISAHAVAIAGVCGMLGCFYAVLKHDEILMFWLLSILLSGLVMTARITLQMHTPKQTYYGFALGFLSGFVSTFFVF